MALLLIASFKQGDELKEDVCFVDITVWGKQGENCAEYLSKGRPAFIEGRLQYSTWESDGQKKSKLEVVANAVQFLGSRGDSQSNSPEGNNQVSSEDDVPF